MQVDGKLIRRLRLGEGMSGAHLAREVEITPQFLSDIERGRRGVHPDIAKRIAVLLGVDVQQIWPPSTKGDDL